MKTRIVRWILSLLLLYGVFTETGAWTTLALFLVVLEIELRGLLDWLKGNGK